jgi:hypothetical protein
MLALEMAAFWLSGQWNSGSVVVTPVVAKSNYKSWNIACANGDTFIVVNHGFKQSAPSGNPATDVAPDEAVISPLTSAIALAGAYGLEVTATQIRITKQNAGGSGGTPAAKLVAERPHSIKE